MAGDIASLAFMLARLELAGANGNMINRARANDRTVALVKKWMAISSALKAARQATISHCEAIEGKNGIVSLKVADRAGFEALQAQIQGQAGELAAVEDGIKKLDAMGELWYSDLEDQCGRLGRVELVERQQIARMSAAYIQKGSNSGKTPDEILANEPEFNRLKKISEDQITQAKEQLAMLRPKLAEVRGILEAVGC